MIDLVVGHAALLAWLCVIAVQFFKMAKICYRKFRINLLCIVVPMMADDNFLSSFLYGEERPIFQHEGIHVSLLMTPKTAGWVDKPHGGFSMGVLTDLAFRIIGRKQTELYPLTVSFRLGGSSLTIGDRVTFHASPHDGAIEGIGLVDGSSQPYIEATIHFQAKDSPASHHLLPPSLLNR